MAIEMIMNNLVLIGLQLDFNKTLIQYTEGAASATWPIAFTNTKYKVAYADCGSSDIDWKDRLKSRTLTGVTIGESKNNHLFIGIGYCD